MTQPTAHFELRWMTALASVAQFGSFTVAAAKLHLTQSAISQQVAALERWAGIQLIRRRPVELTAAGRLMVARHNQLQAHLGQLASDLAQLREGKLGSVHVGAFLSVCRTILPTAFAAYQLNRPNVALRLSQMEPGPALAALAHGELDIAIVFSYEPEFELDDPALAKVPVCDEAVLLAAPPGHPLLAQEEIRLREVSMTDLVPTSDAFVYPPPPDDGGFRYFGDDFSVVLALVAAGRGIALVPRLAAALSPPGVVLRRLSGHDTPRRHVTAVYNPAGDYRIAVEELIEAIRAADSPSTLDP